MSWTKNDRFICDLCGKFSRKFDDYTPFGCADPGNPEPYDPTEFCESCHQKEYQKWLVIFKGGGLYRGDWQKSDAERKAAKELGLVWIHSEGIGEGKDRKHYCYVTKEEYEQKVAKAIS